MKITTTQGDVIINIAEDIKKVGVKISGGADSGILTYLLGKYKKEERPDLTLVPMTISCKQKPYNTIFAEKIIDFVSREFDIEFCEHIQIKNIDVSVYSEYHDILLNMAYSNHLIQEHFFGITKYPPDGVMDHLDERVHIINGNERNRDVTQPTRVGTSHNPFANLDKKGIAELYEKFNLMENLFPLTRSCEEFTKTFDHHCGECWWCRERQWAFNRL